MDNIEKFLLAISVTVSIIFAVFGLAIAVDTQNQIQKLEKRVLVLETRINIYSGANEN